jgi:hypothetical protein
VLVDVAVKRYASVECVCDAVNSVEEKIEGKYEIIFNIEMCIKRWEKFE